MPDRERPESQKQGSRIFFHQPRGDRERPSHSGIYSVIEAARDDSQPKPRWRPISCAQF
jgi:hypothetical protein